MSEIKDLLKNRISKHSDWWNILLEGMAEPTPNRYEDFLPVKENQPKSYYMKPRNMARFLNAMTPYDILANRSSGILMEDMQYPTSAMNISQNRMLNKPAVNLYASEAGEPLNTLGYTIDEIANIQEQEGLPSDMKKYVPQAIQTHELQHFNDIRPKTYNDEVGNRGFMTVEKMPGNIGMRELPAMVAEEDFWVDKGKSTRQRDRLLRLLKSRK